MWESVGKCVNCIESWDGGTARCLINVFIFCRHDSFSNSEISLEQKSAEDAVKDIVPSPLYTNSSSFSLSHASPGPGLFLNGSFPNPPFSAPCPSMVLPASSSSPLHHCATSVFQFDNPFSPASFEERGERQTPPPLPPKPNHPLEQGPKDASDGAYRTIIMQTFLSHSALFPQRMSLSSLDHFRIGLLSCFWRYDGATCKQFWRTMQKMTFLITSFFRRCRQDGRQQEAES